MKRFIVVEGESQGKRMVGSFDETLIKNPDLNLRLSLWIKTPLISPNSEGLSTDSESEELNLFEEFIETSLKNQANKFVGRITFGGAREMYYYISDANSIDAELKQILDMDNVRNFEYKIEPDPHWTIVKSYLE